MNMLPLSSRRKNPAVPNGTRLLDLACCLLALPLLALCYLAMTVVTQLFSPGPVLYRQERVGFQGRRFHLLKFRTMKTGACTMVHQNHMRQVIASNGSMMKLDRHDARLIPGARLLRAVGLDELPQVINVLRGEMSFVGPRPCLPSEFEHYLPWQRERTNALPGLTGLWQVSGKNRTTFDEMIRLDLHYVRQPSLWLNLKIIFLTPWAMIVQIADTGKKQPASDAPVSLPLPEAVGASLGRN